MKKFISLTAIIVLTQTLSYGQVTPFGLQGKIVNSIRLLDDVLYAGTTGDGVFKRALTDTGWTNLGLAGKDIKAICPHVPDGTGFSMLAGIFTYYGGDTTVIYGLSPSEWLPADSGIDASEIVSLSGSFKPMGEHTVYAASPDFRLYKRSGFVWNNILTAACQVVHLSPSGEIWVGGETMIFSPFVAKSTDEGVTWLVMWFDTSGTLGDNSIISFAFDPSSPGILYASGAGGFIIRTTNAGVSWNVTIVPLYRPKLAADPLVANHLSCGGYAYPGNVARLLETFDGGATWQEIALPESLRGIRDIVLAAADSLDVYLATDSSGVYRLRHYLPAFGVNVNPGWNMISIPKHVPDYRKSSMFPTSTSAAFAYDGIYRIRDTLSNGEGFWLKFSTAGMLSIASDTSILADSIDVRVGWNMIGSISKPVLVSTITSDPPGIVTSKFYKYQGSYAISDTIKPGIGYWVKVNQSGKLILSASGATPLSSRITIMSTSEAPPPPPDGETPNLKPETPNRFSLQQNYPNPFNPTTRFEYGLPTSAYVRLNIYNVLGQVVATVVDEYQNAGWKSIQYDATNLSSGLYFYRLEAGQFDAMKKMLILK